jgi:methionyl-tRNA formyltransferase
MKILFLGYKDSPLIDFLKNAGDEVLVTDEKITPAYLSENNPDFLISYGYRYIIKQDILDLFLPNHAINLHISLLPWNRGADPNLWSFIDNTPKGVTIHYLDAGVDTGDIIVQCEVPIHINDTLKSSYDKLHENIQALFKQNWDSVKTGKCPRIEQKGNGSLHKSKDKQDIILENGFDTPVAVLEKFRGSNNE